MALVTKVLLRRSYLCILFNSNTKCLTTNVPLQDVIQKIQTKLTKHKLRHSQLYGIQWYSINTAQQIDNDNYRQKNKITVIGRDIPSPYTDLDSSNFPDDIKKYLINQGFSKPTVIQSQVWPIALSGQNFVGIAQTGTGKTLAYLLPAFIHLKENPPQTGRGPRALILTPTKESARQIEQVVKDFEKLMRLKSVGVYGRANRAEQARELQVGVDIVIATPNRLNNVLMSKITSLHRCTYVMIDEADRMVDMGLEPLIRQVLEGVPMKRQIMMFSGTWPKEVKQLAEDYLGEYVLVNVGSTEKSANRNIQHHFHVCNQDKKMVIFEKIMHDVSGSGSGKILVFTNTKKFVDNLTLMLERNGWPAVGIHGDKTQVERDTVINQYKHGNPNILVATDVDIRSLDVDGITHVINYDFPSNTEDYIRRIGRTVRSENRGVSHSILTEDDARLASGIIEFLREAKQEIPYELEEMAANCNMLNITERQARQKPMKRSWKPNNRWNSFCSPKY